MVKLKYKLMAINTHVLFDKSIYFGISVNVDQAKFERCDTVSLN